MSMQPETAKENGPATAANLLALPFALPGLLDRAAIAAWTGAGEAFGHVCSQWQEEMQKFTIARMRADMEVPTLLSECETPLDLVKAQRIWFAAATQDYLDESTRLAQMGATTMQRGLETWRSLFQPPAAADAKGEAK